MSRWSFLALLLILFIPIPAAIVRGQADAVDVELEYKFGEWIKIRVIPPADASDSSFQAFLQTTDEENTWSSPVLQPGDQEIEFQVNPNEMHLRAFSNLVYWVEMNTAGDQTVSTAKTAFYYEDNRFEWETRSQSPFEVRWHEGDAAFGQNLLDIAQQGLVQVQTLMPLPTPEKVSLYAYANAADMRATLQTGTRNWVGAHTDPDLGVMVVSLPPGPEQRLEMERQIPHELMHILLYQKVGPAYINLPVWLNEGLASIAELYPNPDFRVLLESAYEKETLLPMQSLCNSFPVDAAGAYLAYAQAESFTRYLHQQYGSILLDQLVRQYANGLDCERGIEVTLGSTMNQVEREWRRETLGEDPWSTALSNLAPWLVLLGAVLAVPVVLIFVTLRSKPAGRASEKQR